MLFIVVGATGPTGLQVAQEVLARGHRVMALARTPSKLSLPPQAGLSVVKADAFDPSSLDAAFEQAMGASDEAARPVVVSCLGAHGTSPWKPTNIYSTGARSLVTAMRFRDVRRFLCITSWGTQPGPDTPWYLTRILKPLFFQGFLPDMAESERYLERMAARDGASGEWPALEWTVVRPPGLVNEPAKGKIAAVEGNDVVPGGKWSIPRADLARFLVDAAEQRLHLRTCVAVTSARD